MIEVKHKKKKTNKKNLKHENGIYEKITLEKKKFCNNLHIMHL